MTMIGKIVLLFVLLFSAHPFLSAQDSNSPYMVLDTARYVVRYGFKYMADTVNRKMMEGETVLEIGKHVSRHCFRGHDESELSYLERSSWDAEPKFRFPSYDPAIDNVYIGYPKKNRMTAAMNLGCVGGFLYEEDVPKQDWTLSDQNKVVGGHECRMASCDFGGRRYEAWYAADIPMSLGPWKLGGLPGLILEASDSSGEFVFTLNAIESASDSVVPITMLKRKYRKMSRKKCFSYRARMYREPATFYSALGVLPNGMRIVTPKGGYPYNPIEKED